MFKEGVSLAKDTFDMCLKAALVFLFIPAGFLWVYLKHIGWTSLFLPALLSVQGLIALLLAALLFFSLLLFLLCAPSLFLFAAVVWGQSDGAQPWARRIIVITVIGWLAAVIAGSFGTNLWVFGLVALTLVFCLLLSWLARIRSERLKSLTLLKKLGGSAVFSVVVTLSSLAICIPFLSLAGLIGPLDTDTKASYGLAVLVPLALVGYVPGLIAFSTSRKQALSRMIKAMLIGFGVPAYALFFWLAAFTPGVSIKAVSMVGVIQSDPTLFMVTKPELLPQLMTVGIHPVSKDSPIFKGWMRFAFGDIRLVCSNRYDPNASDITETFNSSSEFRKKAIEAELTAGKGCISLKNDEVRAVS
jgi:hypothetical protein